MMMMNIAETVEKETEEENENKNEKTGLTLQQQLLQQQQSINIFTTSTTTSNATNASTNNKTESDLMPIKTNSVNKRVNFLDDNSNLNSSLVQTQTNTNLGSSSSNNNNNNAEYKTFRSEETTTNNALKNYSSNLETSVLANSQELNSSINSNKKDLFNYRFESTSQSLHQQKQQLDQEKQELLLLNEKILTKLADTNQFSQTEDTLLDAKLNQLKAELEKENEKPLSNANRFNFETSSNESLNQIIKIKKIDINRIEDIYNNDTFFLNNSSNTANLNSKSSKIDFSDLNTLKEKNNTLLNNNSTTFISEKFDEKKYAASDSTTSTVDYVNQARNLNQKFSEANLVDSCSSSCSFEAAAYQQRNLNQSTSGAANNSYLFYDDSFNKTRLTYPVLTSNKLNEQERNNSPNLTSSQFKPQNQQPIINSSNNNNNINNNNNNVFHPTWDEWKRSHSLTKSTNPLANTQDAFRASNNKKIEQTTETKSINSTRSFFEETFQKKTSNTTKSNQQDISLRQPHQSHHHSPPNYLKLNNKLEMKQQQQQHVSRIGKATEEEYTYNPPAPIVTFDGSLPASPTKNKSPTKSPKHYPVYPIDKQPQRAKSPVRLSSVVLARTDKIEPKEIKPEPPEPVLIEMPQPKKIKTILTTQKRKDSAPSLTGWRSDYDSDTDTQSRLLAKASGSIPIEYISIRRDPKPTEKKKSPVKKSITTGTNTSVDYGKRIASTNTNQDELPQYNLHVSLDSLLVKSRREASTSTERVIKNASTETEVQQKDAFTFTDDEEQTPPPPPPPPPKPKPEPEPEPQAPPPQPVENNYVKIIRKSRISEWESVSNPPEDIYRLEFLTISPRSVRRTQQVHMQENYSNFTNLVEDNAEARTYAEVRADDDDRIIFGTTTVQQQQQQSQNDFQHAEQIYSKRSGSFPTLRPVIDAHNQPITRRYVRHTQNTSYTATPTPTFVTVNDMSLMPATVRVSNGFIDREAISQNINNMTSRFNEVFGQQEQQKSINDYFSTQSLQRFERATPVRTERYYKFSRTTNEQVPSFGEIYHRNIASQASNSSAHYRSSSNNYYSQTPIVEMPATPDSTLRASSRQAHSVNNSVIGGTNGILNNAAHSSGYSSFSQKTSTTGMAGPTPLNDSNNWYSSSTSVQQSFEPIVKHQAEAYSSSSLRNTQSQPRLVRGSNREEEEILSSGNECMEPDRQFRPIIQPTEHHDTASSKRQTFATSAYEESQQKKSSFTNGSRT